MLVYKYCWRVTDIHDFRDDTVEIGDEHGLQSQFQQAIGQILCHVHWFPAQNYEGQGHEYDWPTSERHNQATPPHQRFCNKYTNSNRGTAYNWWIALHGYARGAWGGTNEYTLTAAAMNPQTTLNLEWLRERWAADKHDPPRPTPLHWPIVHLVSGYCFVVTNLGMKMRIAVHTFPHALLQNDSVSQSTWELIRDSYAWISTYQKSGGTPGAISGVEFRYLASLNILHRRSLNESRA